MTQFVRRKRQNSHLGLKCVVWIGFNLVMLGVSALLSEPSPDESIQFEEHIRSPRGLNTSQKATNCTHKRNAIAHYPKDLFTAKQRANGAVLLHILAVLYLFLATSIVCEEYFMPAIYRFIDFFQINPSVAGAALVGSCASAPELATTFIGVFVSHNDVGVDAMVGTAMTNYVMIIGLCCLLKPKDKIVIVSPWTVTRDTAWSATAMAVFIIVVIDGKADWDECLIMIIVYLLYVFFLGFDSTLGRMFRKVISDPGPDDPPCCCLWSLCGQHKNKDTSEITKSLVKPGVTQDTEDLDEENVDNEPKSVFAFPEKWDKRVWWFICLPIYVTIYLTTPDCRKDRWKSWFALSLLISIVWITGYSYVILWMATITGHTFGMSDDLMGLTVLGIGTSLPDIVGAVVATNDGEGDMGIATAIGAMVFCMLFCVGLPWFIKSATRQFTPVPVKTAGLTEGAIATSVFMVVVFVLLCFSRFQLRRTVGVICVFLFFAFLVFAVYIDMVVLVDKICKS